MYLARSETFRIPSSRLAAIILHLCSKVFFESAVCFQFEALSFSQLAAGCTVNGFVEEPLLKVLESFSFFIDCKTIFLGFWRLLREVFMLNIFILCHKLSGMGREATGERSLKLPQFHSVSIVRFLVISSSYSLRIAPLQLN